MSKGLFQTPISTRQGNYAALFSKGGDAPVVWAWNTRLGGLGQTSRDLIGIPLWLLFLGCVAAIFSWHLKRAK